MQGSPLHGYWPPYSHTTISEQMSKPIATLKDAKARQQALKASRKEDVFFLAVPKDRKTVVVEGADTELDVVFITRPDRNVLRELTPYAVQSRLFEMAEFVLENCVIDGPKELVKDDTFVWACMAPVENLLMQARGYLGNS